MRRYIYCLLLFFSSNLIAQDQKTLFTDGQVTSGYGTYLFEVGKVNNVNTFLTGFEGGISVNKVNMGIYYISNSDKDDSNKSFSYRHFGFALGLDHMRTSLFHPYINAKFGYGKQTSYVNSDKIGESIITAKPVLGLELNVFRSMKLAFVGSYNYIHKLENKEAIITTDANGLSFGLHFIWGWWK